MTCEATSGARARYVAAALALGCTLASASCGIIRGRAAQDLPATTEAEVTARMNELVVQISNSAGGGKIIEPSASSSSCDNISGDDSGKVRSILFSHQISLSKAADRVTFERVRDYWSNEGWTVTEYWYKGDAKSGNVSAEISDSGFNFSLVSTNSPVVLALIFTSGCFCDETRT